MGSLHDLVTGPTDAKKLRARRVELMRKIRKKTGRHVIIIASDGRKPSPGPPGAMLHPEDVPFFDEIVCSIPEGADADVVVQSAGGLAEAAEKLAQMACDRFGNVRFVVLDLAQSAATILALAGHRLAMRRHASLGPIDPQFVQPNGRTVPAQALTEGVEKILEQSKNGQLNPGYIPILQQVSPADLQAAEDASDLSIRLVTDALKSGMLAGAKAPAKEAKEIARQLCEHKRWLSHGRLISIKALKELGLPVEDLSDSPEGALYDELSSNLVVTFHSNIIKLYESETVDMAKRVTVAAAPTSGLGLPPEAKNADNVNIDIDCSSCHSKIPLQLRFGKDVKLMSGRIPFPKNGKMKCPSCGAELDVTGVKAMLETQLGKKTVDWPEARKGSSK